MADEKPLGGALDTIYKAPVIQIGDDEPLPKRQILRIVEGATATDDPLNNRTNLSLAGEGGFSLPLDLADNDEIIGVAPPNKGGTGFDLTDLSGQEDKIIVVNDTATGYDFADPPAGLSVTGTGFPRVISGVIQSAAVPVDLAGGTTHVTNTLPVVRGGTGKTTADLATHDGHFLAVNEAEDGYEFVNPDFGSGPGPTITNASSGTQNDIASDEGGTPADVLRFTGGTTLITSIAGGTESRRLTIQAVAGPVTLQHDSGGTAVNRIICPHGVNFILPDGSSQDIVYDNVDGRWRVNCLRASPPNGVNSRLVTENDPQTITSKTLESPVVTADGSIAVLFQGTNFSIKACVGELQTSSTSAATLLTYSMTDDTYCQFDAIVTFARRTAVTKRGTYKLSVGYARTGGGAPTITGALTGPSDQETENNTVTIDVSGNDIRVRVTPADSDGRNWSCELRVQETTDA